MRSPFLRISALTSLASAGGISVWTPMCGYEIRTRSNEYSWPSIETMARNVPSLSWSGGLTVNVATVSALAPFKSIGRDTGETVHPCGTASLSSPFTAPVAAVTCTETGFGWFVGNTNTLFATFTKTGGSITNGRRSSPATGSTIRYFVSTI